MNNFGGVSFQLAAHIESHRASARWILPRSAGENVSGSSSRQTADDALLSNTSGKLLMAGRLASLAIVLLLTVPGATAQESRNQLPRKQHRVSDAPFLKPDEAVAKMSIPEGFEVSVFASEPDIAEPIGFCFDDRGRLWVAENFNYQTRREHTNEPVSRIQILEDTDGDGVFDKKKTFTDKLTFTSGLA